MRRFFARNLLFIIGINLLVKPIWVFVIDRNVQNRVGQESFGLYQALFNLAIIFQIVLDFGLNSYNTRSISVSPEKFATQFPQLVTARLLLMSFYGFIVMFAGVLWGYRGAALWLLAGMILLQSSAIMLLFIRSNMAALQRFKLDGVLSVVDRFLMIGACGALLFLPATASSFKIEWFVWSQIGCYAAAIIIGFILLRRIVHIPKIFTFQLKPVLEMLKQGSPYALLAFLMSIFMRSDAFLVERICHDTDPAQAGVYASAIRLLDVTNMISIMFSSVLMPLFGRMLSRHQNVSPIIRLSTNILLPATFLLSIVCWTLGDEIMHFLYTNPSTDYATVVGFLMTAAPAYSILYIYSTLLTSNGHIALLNKLAGAGSILSLLLNAWLIREYMAIGASITACIVMWLLAIAYIIYASRKNNLPFNPKWIGAHVFYVLLLSSSAYGSSKMRIDWRQQLGIIVLAAGVLMLIFRFISIKALKQLLSKDSPGAPE